MCEVSNDALFVAPDFERIVTGADAEINLAEAALLIARGEYPALDVDYYLGCMDEMAAAITRQLPEPGSTPQVLGQINHYLFSEQGYSGNLHNFLDPRNSYLNDVIERRLGIPISLSLLYMEIGNRLGLPIEGISFPGHFLVKLTTAETGTIVLDPFAGGVSLDESDLRRRLQHVLRNSGGLPSLDLQSWLNAATNKAILIRILRNLKSIYSSSADRPRLLRILNYILAIDPDTARELENRAELYEQMQCYQAAAEDFERLCLLSQEAELSGHYAARYAALRRRGELRH